MMDVLFIYSKLLSKQALGKSNIILFHGFCGFGLVLLRMYWLFFLAMMGGYLVLGVRFIWLKGFFHETGVTVRCRISKDRLYRPASHIPELPELPPKTFQQTCGERPLFLLPDEDSFGSCSPIGIQSPILQRMMKGGSNHQNETQKKMRFHETHFQKVSKDPIGGINVAYFFCSARIQTFETINRKLRAEHQIMEDLSHFYRIFVVWDIGSHESMQNT